MLIEEDLHVGQGCVPQLTIGQGEEGKEDKANPHTSYRWSNAEALHADADNGGSNRNAAKEDQARDASHAALQLVGNHGEAVIDDLLVRDRIDEGQASDDSPQTPGIRRQAVQGPEQDQQHKGTTKYPAGGEPALQHGASYNAQDIADTS